VLSGRGLWDKLITRPEESYRLWCVVVCDLETSRMRRPWPTGGLLQQIKKMLHSKVTFQLHPVFLLTPRTCLHLKTCFYEKEPNFKFLVSCLIKPYYLLSVCFMHSFLEFSFVHMHTKLKLSMAERVGLGVVDCLVNKKIPRPRWQ